MKLGTLELVVILLVVIIIFGPTQIPKLTKMFGKSVRNFKEGMEEEDDLAEDSGKVKKAKASVKQETKDAKAADEEKG